MGRGSGASRQPRTAESEPGLDHADARGAPLAFPAPAGPVAWPAGDAGRIASWQRAAGNRAVGRILARTPPAGDRTGTLLAPTVQSPVQRWAWVAGQRVLPTAPGLDPAMAALASDARVHDYQDEPELRAHAAGTTDHVGNLPGPVSAGTWVRFPRGGTSLLGEDHTLVTLDQVVRAVGSTSFVHETFAVDAMTPGSALATEYAALKGPELATFGVAGSANPQQYGAESLFPKLGYALNEVVRYLRDGNLAPLKAGGYVGKPFLRALRTAWAHSADVAAQVAALRAQRGRVPRPLGQLARAYTRALPTLGAFVHGLPPTGYLGDALDTPAHRPLVAPLGRFCGTFVAVMLARVGTDTGLPVGERAHLAAMPRATQAQRRTVLSEWRDRYFTHTVTAAVARGVRYAGMGSLHLDYLRQRGLPNGSHAFYMNGAHLAAAEQLTQARAGSVHP
ncbi:hypothetical protein [Cellulomonas sp. NS3]|uniref:hypothetical protein n=1 Tax=Cellulomonas sp. NS3 TaxID=2973977 RepID=UPI002161EB9C|nr:hypothetical protein [Cellulomonas sp. NS3]